MNLELHRWDRENGIMDPGFYAASGGYITYRNLRLRFDVATARTRSGEKVPLREALQTVGLIDEFESGSTPEICPLEI